MPGDGDLGRVYQPRQRSGGPRADLGQLGDDEREVCGLVDQIGLSGLLAHVAVGAGKRHDGDHVTSASPRMEQIPVDAPALDETGREDDEREWAGGWLAGGGRRGSGRVPHQRWQHARPDLGAAGPGVRALGQPERPGTDRIGADDPDRRPGWRPRRRTRRSSGPGTRRGGTSRGRRAAGYQRAGRQHRQGQATSARGPERRNTARPVAAAHPGLSRRAAEQVSTAAGYRLSGRRIAASGVRLLAAAVAGVTADDRVA